ARARAYDVRECTIGEIRVRDLPRGRRPESWPPERREPIEGCVNHAVDEHVLQAARVAVLVRHDAAVRKRLLLQPIENVVHVFERKWLRPAGDRRDPRHDRAIGVVLETRRTGWILDGRDTAQSI